MLVTQQHRWPSKYRKDRTR